MNLVSKVAALRVLAVIALTGCAMVGCGSSGGGSPSARSAGPRHATVSGCAAAAVRSVRQHVRIQAMPAGCRGLAPAALGQAVSEAIGEVTAGQHKTVRRHRAYLASAGLGYLITAASRAAPPAKAGSPPGSPAGSPARSPVSAAGVGGAGGSAVPAALAALIAWLLTAASGGYLLGRLVAAGGLRRGTPVEPGRSPAEPGRSPVVILSHFGLAVCGLAAWIGYLISNAAAVAWVALGFLLPVTGLGIATLILTIPGPAGASAALANMSPASAARDRALPAGVTPPHAATGSAGTASPPLVSALVLDPAGAGLSRPRAPVVVIAAHGVLATATLLLVLLAAMAAH